ncbi:MAG: TonB-dependent receptor plug domain-containing protein, partial [Gemmatimonadaceae bacterium]
MYTPPARAQDTTRARVDTAAIRRAAMRDSIAADSAARATARRDSIAAARAADTIKAPIAAFATPPLADVGRTHRWNRDELFATGALTLNDLLVRVPGVVTFTSGWLAAPQVAGIGGELRTVRVFIDGFEYEEINPRAGSIRDLSLIPLWTLDEVRIEATGREVRVHLTTWSVRSTTAATRVDVATGDYDTNAYRGYYGKRLHSGGMLQFGAYQYSTQDNQLGDGDHLALMARAGWARGRFSMVGTYYTLGLDRSEQLRLAVTPPRPNLPSQESRYNQAHARVAYGDPSQNGFWAQLGAGAFQFKLTRGDSIGVRQVPGQTVPETTIVKRDTTRTRPQYLGALGYTMGPFRISAASRVHA